MRWTPLSRQKPKHKQNCRVLMVEEDLDLVEIEAVFREKYGFIKFSAGDDESIIPAQYWRSV